MAAPDPAAWSRLKERFEAALALPPAEREAFVAGLPEADLRGELRSLLAAHRDDDFLAPPLPDALRRIGPFTLQRVLGAGGMGTVYAAAQEAPQRTVALKVLRPFGADAAAVRRFEHEAAVLARLQHPGIAQVFAAGTTVLHGVEVPWFAMELVDGARPLLQFAREERLGREARLRLCLAVCEAVQHGHQKGIVHRDLKPGNVLVDRHGVVKVIDFGVARASGAGPESLHTTAGELLGTLAYMSPEQCGGDPDAVDTRSDVHALGVLLYELLTGRLPFPVAGLDLLAGLRVVATAAPAPAREVPADLQAVLGRALEKRPDERYASVAAFAADVRAVLEDRPVAARPAGPWRQLRLYARRHRGRVVAMGVVAATVLAAAGTSLAFGFVASARAEETAQALVVAGRERDAAEQNLDLLLRSLRAANPLRERRDVSVGELLGTVAAELAARQHGDPHASARLHQALAGAYRGIGRGADAVVHGEAALTDLAAVGGADSAAHRDERIDVLLGLAAAHAEAAEPDRATARYREALELLPAGVSPVDPRRAEALTGLGGVRLSTKDLEGAAHWLELALAEPPVAGAEQIRAEALANVGTLRWQRGDLEGAAVVWRESLDLFGRSLWPEHPTVAQVRSNFGLYLQNQGQHAEAAAMFTAARDLFARLRGADSPDVANAELKLGFLHVDTGDAAAARAAFTHALRIRRARFPGDPQQVAPALQALGYLELQQGAFAEALAGLDEALALRRTQQAEDHREVLDCQLLRARALLGLDRTSEALPLLRAVVAKRRAEFGAEHPRTAMAESALGDALRRAGDLAAARPLLETGLARIVKALGERHPEARAARARLADLEDACGNASAAAAHRGGR